jgi:DNA invertase Pin-like site-specific DNA recombinase
MGARREGADDFHADRDQTRLINGAVPRGDTLHMMPPELNVSGGLPLEQRPSLLAAIEGIESGEYGGIIVGYLSRLGRSVKEQLRTYDRVHAAGGRIIVAQEGIDARTRGGRLQRNILAAIHEDEREQHVERFDDLRRGATDAGIWQRRQVPTGYIRDATTRKLVPGPRAETVRAAYRARAAGAGATELGRLLGMTPTGAARLIANRVYLGELKVGPYTNPSAHPPLVDEALWNAAQSPATVRPARSGGEPALLAGLVRCAGCTHVMSRNATKVVMYTCHGQHSAGMCPAPAGITARLLDAHVTEIAHAYLRQLVNRPSVRDHGREERVTALRDAEQELASYLEGVAAAGLEPGQFAAGATIRRDAVDVARGELQRFTAGHPDAVPSSVLEDWERMSYGQRNRLLRGLIETVLVRRAGGRGHIVPIRERVRVIARGAGLVTSYGGGGVPMPIVTVELPDLDDVRVLGV